MCKPCMTTAANAAECRPTDAEPARATEPVRRRTRKPTVRQELDRTAAAVVQAVGAFDELINEFSWEEARDGTPEADAVVGEFKAAGQLIRSAVRILARRFPKDFRGDHLAPHSYGAFLRHAARLMDEVDRDTGLIGIHLDENDHAYHLLEMCPHLLADRSTRNPESCPLCGSKREFHMFCDDDGDREAWVCFACEGHVKKAKQVLRSRRVDKHGERQKNAKKGAKLLKAIEAKQAAEAKKAAPATLFGLPWLGEIDCRTDEEKAEDEAAGVPPPVCFIPNTATPAKPKPKPKPRMGKAPAIHNRIADIV